MATDGITVLGNFSVDHVDGGPPTPGGCPVFAAMAIRELDRPGRVVGRLAREDSRLFRGVLDEAAERITPLWAPTTSSFGLRYGEGERLMTVEAVSEPWTEAEIEEASIGTTWVHLAPLLRGEFSVDLSGALASRGHRLSFDGQGLVRVPELGPLRTDDDFDRELLRSIDVLKLNREEAAVLAGGDFDDAVARDLGVPEIVLTFGSGGCDLYLDGSRAHVPADPIEGVQTTGTGDAFMVSYASDRAAGVEPLAAARRASKLVSAMLTQRREVESRSS